MIKLKDSGYNRKFRREILDSALHAFNKMVEEDKNGTKPLYRKRWWNKEEREKQKQKKKLNWFQNPKIDYKSILFVPPTPGGDLVKALRKREAELNNSDKNRIKL